MIDQELMGLDLVLRAAEVGHDVRWAPYCPTYPTKIGVGMTGFTRVSDWRPSMPWVGKDGLVILTGNYKFLQELDRYRELGYRVFGPTVASAKLEINRNAGMEAMKSVGIEVPPYETLDTLEAAYKFARKSDRAWVLKPLGDEGDKSLTYVSDDPADLTGFIGRLIASGKKYKGQFMLQEKVDVLAEFGVSGWCGPEGFLPGKWQECFEHKKLMNDEIGPATGEQGTVCGYSETSKLADEMLRPMEPVIRALGHRGDFAIGVIVDKKGKAWPCEFTARLGWPAFFLQVASHKGDPIKWMSDLMDGKDSLRVSDDACIGVVMAQPPYPYDGEAPDKTEGNPIAGTEKIGKNWHPVSVMCGKGPVMEGGKVVDGETLLTARQYVGVVTALGKTVSRAKQKAYDSVDQVRFPQSIYRTDIGDKVIDCLPKLHSFGYALEIKP